MKQREKPLHLQLGRVVKNKLEMGRRTGRKMDPWNNDRIKVHIHLVELVEWFTRGSLLPRS
jgi:hypothetical protein